MDHEFSWPTFQLKVKLLGGKLPRQEIGSAGYDLYAASAGAIPSGQRLQIPVGIATEFTPGWVGHIWGRSSMGGKGLIELAGVIDANYRGPWAVLLYNSGNKPWSFDVGDKIAQVVFVPHGSAVIEEVTELGMTERGENGFGSTGK